MKNHLSWTIIKRFAGRDCFGFSLQEVVKEFPEKHPVYLARLLSTMVKIGMLCKTTRDNYHIIPLNKDHETYAPGAYQVAKYFMQNKSYYIGYASALKIHGIRINNKTLQSGSAEYVVTKKQIRPSIRKIGGINFHFIYHKPSRFFGYSSTWITQFEKAMVSDLERTIVDIATAPGLCGGIVELGSVLFEAKELADKDKLFYYFNRNLNSSAKKRFLFLTNLLELEWTPEHDRMRDEAGSGTSILDPSAPVQGKKTGKFGLKVNVDPRHIRNEVLHRSLAAI